MDVYGKTACRIAQAYLWDATLENYLAQRRKKAAGSSLLDLIRRDSVATDAREENQVTVRNLRKA
jgi:hypothetical protein